MASFTPGPWVAEAVNSEHLHDICLGYQIPKAGSPILIATVYGDHEDDGYPVSDHQAEANARLIAAAPELLTALERCQIALIFRLDFAEILDEEKYLLDVVRAAIAKAKGA